MHTPVDYNVLAETYDLSRTANMDTVNRFSEVLPLDGKVVLDFGCGTGNFAHALKTLTTAKVYGVEPSNKMREKAIAKGIDAREGNHADIPFEGAFFDFIYMTDVIHHVPNLTVMFSEFRRVLKPRGIVGILTESHVQLSTRYWVRYFPSTVDVERKRYPDIPDIIKAAESAGLSPCKTVITDREQRFTIPSDFVRLVEEKGYSMFHLIEDADYEAGLAALREDAKKGTEITCDHGETLLFLQ